MNGDIKEVLLTEEQIAAKTKEIGAKISRDYEGKNPLIISVLKGSFIFMADLARQITVPCTFDFMSVSSYGSGTRSSGEVKIIKDLDTKIENRDIIIVEDILDSGVTLSYILQILKARGAKSIALCVFLDKPDRRKVPVHIDYCAFAVPDEFVVGYGMDYGENYRNLPYIGILKPTVYKDK